MNGQKGDQLSQVFWGLVLALYVHPLNIFRAIRIGQLFLTKVIKGNKMQIRTFSEYLINRRKRHLIEPIQAQRFNLTQIKIIPNNL